MKEVAAEESEAMTSLKSASERQKNISKKLKRLNDGLSDKNTRIPSYESRKILINDPGRLKRHSRKILELEKEIARTASIKDKQRIKNSFKNYKRATDNFNENIPNQKVLNESSEKKLEALENLSEAHEQLAEALNKMNRDIEKSPTFENKKLKQQSASASAQLEKNLEDQKNLKEFLKSEIDQEKLKQKLKKELLAEQQKSVEDMKQSIDDLESFLEKSSKNELFSEDLLDKMEQIQELLKETLPDSLIDIMKKKMEGEQVNPEDVQQSLENLMNNKESFEQNIDRALHQLKKLKEFMKMESWKKELQEVAGLQESLKDEIENLKPGSSEKSRDKLQNKQESIKNSMKNITDEMNNSSALQSKAKEELSRENQKKLREKMDAVKSSLKKSDVGEKSPASRSAEQAEDQIKGMVQALNDMMSGMNSSSASIDPYKIQILVYESIKLAALQQLIVQSEKKRRIYGWDSEPVTLYSNSLQVARWLYQNLQKLSVELPIVSPYLLTQSRMLVASLESASTERNRVQAGKALGYNQNITRELLKLLKFLKNMPQGSGSGQGGSGQNAQENSGEQGKGLSESLKGLSGKQLALNQTTSQLLKSMLKNRNLRRGQLSGGKDRGKDRGKEGEGSPQELANRQGGLSESLESMAESAGNEGGAATKLRKLAEEARALEKRMRKGGITSDLTKNQEKFKARLLETSRALEERGFGSRREGKYSEKTFSDNGVYSGIKKEEWLLLLENEKKRVRKLQINAEERDILSIFFESLLTK